ncbi:hypothetical protein ACQ86G_07700 [Roseateles chitinivorans]|uniref:hypothetical protein n=1 Tax=Roseateles chitinivorans TaxID=2917965 RepID=UPI003D676C52
MGTRVGQVIELKSGRWRAAVAPDRGGRLRWLGANGSGGQESWLRPLLIERGTLVGGGAVRLVPPSEVAEDMAHLVPDPGAFEEPWRVIHQASDAITLMLNPCSPAPGTWGLQASQTLRLDECRLDWTLSVRNLSRMPMPARLGWLLNFPDDFADAAWLDDTLDVVKLAGRGQVARRDPWCGIASLSGAGGRLVLLRGEPPMDTLSFERHPTRTSVQLRLMTPDTPRLTPLPRGEELTLRLSIELLESRTPPLPRVPPHNPSGSLIL